ncbi:PASTA domain-containing protein [Caproiciproducens sp. NJN-50]|uniref:PASTA domain-containing protein n=1 Tax=Acutalibacteraceae TaxID=3082771 RepID=UPI000FFE1E32|nr:MULTISPECIES: PASTA domain-containing protein [Acutalibacteraceae]QAT50375.1 PASTA domain-containing protein [Caproiciproducens sp. NJN-50]
MTDPANLCMNCMSEKEGGAACPRCGWLGDEPQMTHALPLKTMLQKRYLVGVAKKSNGEGIIYIGYDTVLNIPIELHEFFPQTLSERAANGTDVRVVGGSEIIFNESFARFLSYSREIAHMRELSAIVQIYDIFEENHTAYTVSEWNDSITLRYFVERSGGRLSWNAARQLFMPVLSALSVLHAHSVGHLGISPDTLFIMEDGRMKLGGFSIGSVRQMDTDLPPDMTDGCAAIEQYVMDYQPNEATDVYGFAASLFFTLTGTLPPDALKRRGDSRLFIPTAVLHTLPPYLVTALANALQVSPDRRTPTFERLRVELSAASSVTAALEETRRISRMPGRMETGGAGPDEKKKRELPGFVWVLASCAVMLIVFTAIGMFWISRTPTDDRGLAAGAATDASDSSSAVLLEKSSADQLADSSDENKITVPNLVGQNYDQFVEDVSSSQGTDYQILLSTRQFSDTVPEGCIISQQPAANGKMAKGTAIVVVVSEGAAVRTLPEISGETLPDASENVTSAGFVPTKAEAYSGSVPSGLVIGYQNAKEGSQMAYGSKVVIVVSKGPNPNPSASSSASSAG